MAIKTQALIRIIVSIIVIAMTALLPHTSLAQTSGNSDSNTIPRPVEAGPGGEIKLERKYRTVAESNYEWHAHFFSESRYVTEGRDNLAGNNIHSVSSEFTLDGLSIIPWLATASGTDYTEFDLNIVYGAKVATGFSVYAGYTYIYSRDNGLSDNDNELSLDLAYKLIDHVSLLTSIYHSLDARGTFVEMATKYARPLSNTIQFSAQVIVGVNAGYVTDGHRRLNNIQLRSTVSYQPTAQIDVYAYLSTSRAINRDANRYAGDATLGDFSWGGAGFSYLF